MKVILAALFLFASAFAAPQDEVLVLEELIASTRKNLEGQQQLLSLIQEFNQSREAFLADPDSGKLATALVRRAMRLHGLLEKERLSYLFSSDFLQEIAFYTSVGKSYASLSQNKSPAGSSR